MPLAGERQGGACKTASAGFPMTAVEAGSARKLIAQATQYAQGLGLAPHPDYKEAARVFGGLDFRFCFWQAKGMTTMNIQFFLDFLLRDVRIGRLGEQWPGKRPAASKTSPAVTMTRTEEASARLATKKAWSVVVAYEDPAARERAVGFCDQLVERFWAQVELDISWWSFTSLEEAAGAREAVQEAAQAELIIVSTAPEGDLPATVKAWIEAWLRLRGEREGVLAGLTEGAEGLSLEEGPKHLYLRRVAHLGAMDYLTQVPSDMSRAIPDSLESYTERADQITCLLDGILQQQAPPPQLRP
jgi:sulfite reductase alpha subunit-like flavoprotein